MTAEHLPVVYVTCPNNHRTGTVKPTGKIIQCQRCFHELDKTVMVMVPPRPAGPPKRLEIDWGHDECRTCRTTAPRPGEKLLPYGWMSVMVGTNPAAEKYGRTRVYHGPYCSARCAIAALEAADRGADVNVSHLVTMKPSGGDR